MAVLDDSDKEDDYDEELGDWAKLEMMHSSHLLYFAKKLAQVFCPLHIFDLMHFKEEADCICCQCKNA